MSSDQVWDPKCSCHTFPCPRLVTISLAPLEERSLQPPTFGEKENTQKKKAYFQSVNFIQHHYSSVEPSLPYVRWHNCDRSYFFTLNWRKKSKRKYLLAFVYYPVNEMIRINSLILPLCPTYCILSVSTSELRQSWENKTLWDVLWATRLATHKSSVRMSTFPTNEVLFLSIHVTWNVIQASRVAY